MTAKLGAGVRSPTARMLWQFGLVAGAANLVGLIAGRSNFLGVVRYCERTYPDGCEPHMLMGPFIWASWIGVGTGVLAAFAATLIVMAFGRLEMSLAWVRRVAGALFVYAGSISILVAGLMFIPYWFYVLLAIFIAGPSLAVMTAIRDPR